MALPEDEQVYLIAEDAYLYDQAAEIIDNAKNSKGKVPAELAVPIMMWINGYA